MHTFQVDVCFRSVSSTTFVGHQLSVVTRIIETVSIGSRQICALDRYPRALRFIMTTNWYRVSNYPDNDVTIIGASLSEPHINGTSAARVCYMYVLLSLSIVRRAIIQCRLLFCVHNSTFQHAICARAARDQLGGAGRPS